MPDFLLTYPCSADAPCIWDNFSIIEIEVKISLDSVFLGCSEVFCMFVKQQTRMTNNWEL